MSLVVCRRPRLFWSALAGLSIGLAWALESRGLLVLPVTVALLGIASMRLRTKGVFLAVTFFIALGGGWFLKEHLKEAQWSNMISSGNIHSSLVVRQKDVVHRWISGSDANLTSCRSVAKETLLTTAFLKTQCSRDVLARNIRHRLPVQLPAGPTLTGLAILLLLLPGRRGWRSSVEGGLVVLMAGAAFVGMASLTLMPPRYFLQQAPFFAVIVGAGVARLGGVLPSQARWLQPLVVLGVSVWVFLPGIVGQMAEGQQLADHYDVRRHAHAVVDSVLAEGDQFMDCSDHGVELALLPRRPQTLDIPMHDASAELCLDWIEMEDASTRWMMVHATKEMTLRGRDGVASGVAPVDLRKTLAETPSWVLYLSDSTWQLWRKP